ncbi:hypothetical protein Bca4012_073389 [Brassica carinata]
MLLLSRGSSDSSSTAKLLVENECAALLEDLSSQRKIVKELHLELEEGRYAAASAANETMSMILRLQREKAEIQMEARQFKVFAKEKMTHDQEKLKVMKELLYEKEQAIEALSYELVDDENPSGPDGNVEVVEKVMVGQSPYYDPNSPLEAAKEIKGTDSPMSCSSDSVYTIDSVHVGQGVNEPDIEKLYTRLQALEAQLKHTIVSMRTDKAQLVLLKEIAKETVTTKRRHLVSKMPSFKAFCVVTVLKWIVSFVSWRRKAKQNK